MKRVFITGATGDIGQAILPILAEHYSVIALVRVFPSYTIKNVEWVKGDAGVVASYEKYLHGVQGVVHLAALLRSENTKKLFQENVQNTLDLVDAAHRAGCQNIIVFSTAAVTQEVLTPYAESKKIMEKKLLAKNISIHVVRPTLVYGKNSHYLNVFRKFLTKKSPIIILPNYGRASLYPVWNEDIGRGLLCLLVQKPTGIMVHDFCSPLPTTMYEFLELFSEAWKRPMKKIVSPPHRMVVGGVHLMQILSIPVPRVLISLAASGGSYRVQPDLFSHMYQMKFKTPQEVIPRIVSEGAK